eukprot:1161964-Pelagomonas_calceolata.AAC.7
MSLCALIPLATSQAFTFVTTRSARSGKEAGAGAARWFCASCVCLQHQMPLLASTCVAPSRPEGETKAQGQPDQTARRACACNIKCLCLHRHASRHPDQRERQAQGKPDQTARRACAC